MLVGSDSVMLHLGHESLCVVAAVISIELW